MLTGEHDRLWHGRQAVALARTGLARHAVLAAQRDYESLGPDDEVFTYTEAALAKDLGRCLLAIGEPQQAITLGTTALRDYEPWRVRNRR